MCLYVYIYIYIYIYICACMCVQIHKYVYVYIYTYKTDGGCHKSYARDGWMECCSCAYGKCSCRFRACMSVSVCPWSWVLQNIISPTARAPLLGVCVLIDIQIYVYICVFVCVYFVCVSCMSFMYRVWCVMRGLYHIYVLLCIYVMYCRIYIFRLIYIHGCMYLCVCRYNFLNLCLHMLFAYMYVYVYIYVYI